MEKHVQTELPEALYARLRRRAREEKRPIKRVVQDALEAYLSTGEGSDPLDALIGTVEVGGDWSTRKDWRDPIGKKARR